MTGPSRLRGRLARDDGFTLVELLVVMILLSLIGALVVSWVVTTQRQTAGTQVRLNDIDQARIGMDAITKTLRTAVEPAQLQLSCSSCTGSASTSTALTNATATSVQLFANFGDPTGPVLVTFTVAFDPAANVATLTETSEAPDPGSAPNFTYTACTIGAAGCPITRRTLVRGLTWPLPGAAFTYYDNAGTALPLGTNGALSAPQRIAVDSVDITLPVHTPNPYGTGPMTVTDRVALPNAAAGVLPTPPPGP